MGIAVSSGSGTIGWLERRLTASATGPKLRAPEVLMPRTHLRETVGRLRHEIDAGEPLGPNRLIELREALDEIEGFLESGETSGDASVGDKLRTVEADFEGSHPKLASALRAVVNALSRLGI